MQSRLWRAAAAAIAGSLLVTASIASTTTYEYDVHGRLKKVTNGDGSIVVNTWDKATNRTQLQVSIPPGIPASISVPASSTTGSFTVSWGAATGTVTAYELYEATNSGFSGQVIAYSGTSTSVGLSGRGNGTYYYRVRACNGALCSAYREGANGTTVLLPPGLPASISVPSSSGGSHTVSWGAASGSVSAYELFEATNTSFSGQVLLYNAGGLSHGVTGRPPGTYYYRVRACNGSGCSDYRTGANGTTVAAGIQVLNPAISVGPTGQLTSINTLANLNGHPATIHGFTLQSCWSASATIQSGAQSVRWTNSNFYFYQCEQGNDIYCSASYVIRNSSTGSLHNGSSAITITAQPKQMPGGTECP